MKKFRFPHRPGGSREGVAGAGQGDGCSMGAPKIQISQLLSETKKDCDNIVITVLCVSVTKEIPYYNTLFYLNFYTFTSLFYLLNMY